MREVIKEPAMGGHNDGCGFDPLLRQTHEAVALAPIRTTLIAIARTAIA